MCSVVVGSPAFSLVALTAQDANETLFEFTAVAGINDGVQAAVEVAEPEDHLKKRLWRPQIGVKRT